MDFLLLGLFMFLSFIIVVKNKDIFDQSFFKDIEDIEDIENALA